jgi:uncharacterized cupredoxin-like copper-binding protein
LNVLRTIGALALLAVTIAACAAPSVPASPSMPGATIAATRIAVSLTDNMRIEPAAMSVPAEMPITFVVTNTGQIEHEFTLGDADVQDEHEQEMLEMGGMPMTHDEDNAVTVAPGATKELVYTFASQGTSLAGCHVPGHYPAGMKATITIV